MSTLKKAIAHLKRTAEEDGTSLEEAARKIIAIETEREAKRAAKAAARSEQDRQFWRDKGGGG
jgi:hypothetical protein